MSKPERPIIIKKKVVGHDGHHGGAWKVAYADFVTALMSLFIVLWLMSSSTPVKEAIAGYFRDPAGAGKLAGTHVALGKTIDLSKDDMEKLKQELQHRLEAMPKFDSIKDQIAITVTNEGLRIELMETAKGLFFENGSPKPTEAGVELLRTLAAELTKLPNRIVIEGHTDAAPFSGEGTYSNWELSADRANSARQLMQGGGLRAAQVFQVRGFADQELRDKQDPRDPRNRRISVIVHYLQVEGENASEQAAQAPQPPPVSPAHPARPSHTD
jgi:chemotaxis protein MotB